MSEQHLTLDKALEIAKQSEKAGIANIAKAQHILKQLAEQVRAPTIHFELWKIERMLHPDWCYASQAGQDRFVYEQFFANSPPGTFVDVGAHDGVNGSNTLFFERQGWSGLCLEPSPSQFANLQKNRRSTLLNVAAAEYSGTEEFLEIQSGYTQMGGLTRDLHNRKLSESSPSHQGQVIEVKVQRLSEILEEASIDQVDYCSIDVEGSEMRVLDGVDFGRHPIRVLSIENSNHYKEKNGPIASFLKTKGYRHVETIGYDEIFCLDS